MKLIVGLGNPGSKYAGTRHNAGRMVIEAIAAKQKKQLKHFRELQASAVSFDWENIPVTIAWPETFMNISGGPIRRMVEHFKVDSVKDLLVIIDEAAIPLGRLRLRSNGSDGGHNGLKSVEQSLGSQDYTRLRIGIAPEKIGVPLEEYVLGSFEPHEREKLNGAIERAIEGCRLWATGPVERAMNVVNPSGD